MAGGFLSGMFAGMGQTAGQVGHKMLDIHTKKVSSLADLYKSIASNPNFDPQIQSEAMTRATQLESAGPFDFKTPKKLSNFKDMFEKYDEVETQKMLQSMRGQAPTGFTSEYASGTRRSELVRNNDLYGQTQLANAQQEARRREEFEYKQKLADSLGDDAFAQGVPADHPIHKVVIQNNRLRFMNGQPMMGFKDIELNGKPGVMYTPTGQYFIGKVEVNPDGTVKGDAGRKMTRGITRDQMGYTIETNDSSTPILPGTVAMPPPPAPTAQPGLTAPPAGIPGAAPPQSVPQAQPVARPPQQSVFTARPPVLPAQSFGPPAPGQEWAAPPQPTGAPETALPLLDYIDQAIPGNDPVSVLARRYATLSDDGIKAFTSNRYAQPAVQAKLEQAGIWVPNKDQSKAVTALEDSRHPVQLIGSLMDRVFKTGDLAAAIELNDQILSLGSIFAKTTYQQTGQLSNQEQIWARKGFTGALRALIASQGKNFAAFKLFEEAGRANLHDVMWLSETRKQTMLKGKERYRYIAGYGPIEEFTRKHDAYTPDVIGGAPSPKPDWREDGVWTQGKYKGQPRYRLFKQGKPTEQYHTNPWEISK